MTLTDDGRELLSKAQYARRHGRRHSAVSNWIRRQQLTAPALRADGKIDALLADKQLGLRLDPLRARLRNQLIVAASGGAVPALLTPEQAQAELLRARAAEAAIKVERARRELNAQTGRYVLAEEMRREYGQGIMEHLTTVELSLPDLAQRLGVGREGLLELRRWWRQQRQATAERNRIEASAYPEFVADPEQ